MSFCPRCGASTRADEKGVPVCGTHGPQWELARNAPCADVIIVRNSSVLLSRRQREPYAGRWELPGGYQNRGEHPADTARREVREELGVDVELTELMGIYLDPYGDSIVQVTVYIGALLSDRVKLDRTEVSEIAWFDVDELPPESDLALGHRRRLDDWAHFVQGDQPKGLGLGR